MSLKHANGNSKTLLGVFLLIPYFMSVVLLSSFGSSGLFESALVFGMILVASLLFCYVAKAQGYEPIKWISGKFTLSDWKWVGAGYAGLFISVFAITTVISGSIGILIALGVGGLILAYVLLKTETVLAPILAHFFYNMSVILLASNVFGSVVTLSQSPVFIPRFGFDLNDINNTGSQAFLQFAFVAAGEELMKVSLAIGVSMLITRNKTAMVVISVALWTLLHAIISYRVA